MWQYCLHLENVGQDRDQRYFLSTAPPPPWRCTLAVTDGLQLWNRPKWLPLCLSNMWVENFKLMEKEEQSLPPLHGHKKFLCFKGRGRNKNKSVSVRAGGNDPYPRIQALLKRVAYSDRGVPNPWAKDSVPIQSGSHSVVPNSLQLHQL